MKRLCYIVCALWSGCLWGINEEAGWPAAASRVSPDRGMSPAFYEDVVGFGLTSTDTYYTLEELGEMLLPHQGSTVHSGIDMPMAASSAAMVAPVVSVLPVLASDDVSDYGGGESPVNSRRKVGRPRNAYASPNTVASRKSRERYTQARKILESLKNNPTHGHSYLKYRTLVEKAEVSPEAQQAQRILNCLVAERKRIQRAYKGKAFPPEVKERLLQIQKENNKYKQRKFRAQHPHRKIMDLYKNYVSGKEKNAVP